MRDVASVDSDMVKECLPLSCLPLKCLQTVCLPVRRLQFMRLSVGQWVCGMGVVIDYPVQRDC